MSAIVHLSTLFLLSSSTAILVKNVLGALVPRPRYRWRWRAYNVNAPSGSGSDPSPRPGPAVTHCLQQLYDVSLQSESPPPPTLFTTLIDALALALPLALPWA